MRSAVDAAALSIVPEAIPRPAMKGEWTRRIIEEFVAADVQSARITSNGNGDYRRLYDAVRHRLRITDYPVGVIIRNGACYLYRRPPIA